MQFALAVEAKCIIDIEPTSGEGNQAAAFDVRRVKDGIEKKRQRDASKSRVAGRRSGKFCNLDKDEGTASTKRPSLVVQEEASANIPRCMYMVAIP